MRIELNDPNRKEDDVDKLISGLKPVKDEKRTFRSEIAKMKGMDRKTAFQYFWDYYKWPVIIIIAVIIAAISVAHSVILNSRPWIIEVSIYNNVVEDDSSLDTLAEQFAEYEGLNLDDYQILISADSYYDPDTMSEEQMASVTKFMAQVSAQELDIVGGDRTFLDSYAYGQEDSVYFMDLEEVLPEAVFSRLNADGRIYWSKYTDEDGNVTGEYAAAINIENSKLTTVGGLEVTPSYIGIIPNTQRLDTAIDFIIWNFDLQSLDDRDDGEAETQDGTAEDLTEAPGTLAADVSESLADTETDAAAADGAESADDAAAADSAADQGTVSADESEMQDTETADETESPGASADDAA